MTTPGYQNSTQNADVFPRRFPSFCNQLVYVGKKLVKRNSEKTDKQNDITRFWLVDVAFPKINGFLAHADVFCERRLRNFFFQPQFFYFVTDFHMYNFSRNLLRKLDKEENFLYNIGVF